MTAATLRNLRLLAALTLALAVGWASYPYLANYVSSLAVVNAPLDTVLSPLRGRVTVASPPAGTAFAPGTLLVEVTAEGRERGRLEDLRARLAEIDDSERAARQRLARLAALAAAIERRMETYRRHTLARLAAERREAAARLAAARAREAAARAELARAETLARDGHAAAARREAAAAAHAAVLAEIEEIDALIAGIDVEVAAVRDGVAATEAWNDVPYSRQRLDEIALHRAAIEAELARLAGERRVLRERLAAEERLLAERDRFRLFAPAAGVVWKASRRPGDSVVPGDVLLQTVDCAGRFVEVALPESRFGDVSPGDAAWVRLRGAGEAVTAPVTAVIGGGAKFDHPSLAARVPEAPPGRLRVLVSLEASELDRDPAAFCHVGRTAEVRFRRPLAERVARLRAEMVALAGAIIRAAGIGPARADGEPF